ncbi:hypothetical protein [Alkalihalobacillus sp. TS-13]|nr:hypothetical protein [Alkalihalobacillus sp. TS-13]
MKGIFAADMGYASIKFTLDAINGKEVPKEHFVDLENITEDNVQ